MAEPTTPTKYINLERMLSSPTLLLSSPGRTRNSFAHGIPDGAPIQGLTTPTKGNIQNIAPKETIAISPTKLFLSSSQMSTSSKFPEVVKAPVKVLPHHNGMKDTKQVQYIRLVTSQGVETAGRSVISAGPQYSNSKYQSVVATSQHPVTSYLNKPSADSHNDSSSTVQNVMLPNTGNPLQLITTVSNMTGDGDSSQLYTLMSSPNLPQAQPARKEVYTPSSGQTHVHDSTTPTAISVPQSNLSITQQSFGQDIIKLRKPCNCTKSQCLKLYCDCFANGEFCSNCNCQNCFNNLDHEEERQKAVKQCLERNPQAFHPKIGKGSKADSRRHQKGCNCKRSGCLKNYCECYEAKIPCGVMCKCVGCKNYEENTEKKTFHVDMVENRRVPQALHTQKIPSQFMSQVHQTQTRLPHEYLKKNVIKAIMDCLITQCREAEVAKCKDGTTEKVVLEEFGRCLHDIISTCMKTQH